MAVILTYGKGETTDEIRIACLNFRPKPYIRTPARCFRCNSYGHIVKHCLRNPKCSRCSGAHTVWECPTPEQQSSSCASCGSTSHITGDNKCTQKIRAKEISRMVTQGLSYAQAAKTLDRPVSSISEVNDPKPATRKREEEQTPAKIEKLLDQLESYIVSKINNANKELQNKIDESNNRYRHIADRITNIVSKLDDLTKRLEDIEEAQKSRKGMTMENMENIVKNLKTCKANQRSMIDAFKDIFNSLLGMTEAAAFSNGSKEDRNLYDETNTELYKACAKVTKIVRLCDPDDKHVAAQGPMDT